VREKRENGWSSSIDLGIWRRLDQKEIGAQKEEEGLSRISAKDLI